MFVACLYHFITFKIFHFSSCRRRNLHPLMRNYKTGSSASDFDFLFRCLLLVFLLVVFNIKSDCLKVLTIKLFSTIPTLKDCMTHALVFRFRLSLPCSHVICGPKAKVEQHKKTRH